MADPIKVKVLKDGPYLVEGPIEVVNFEGKPIPAKGSPVALCRCGGSTKKPFCDGTHSKIGFKGAEAAVDSADKKKP